MTNEVLLPENRYAISGRQFLEVVALQEFLQKATSDDEVIDIYKRTEPVIIAEALIEQVDGHLVAANGLTMGGLKEPENIDDVLRRVFYRNLLDLSQRDYTECVAASLKSLKRREPSDKGLSYNEAIEGQRQWLVEQTDEAISSRRKGMEAAEAAMGFRLIGLTAFWGAATDPKLRAELQKQVKAEYVRTVIQP